MKTQYDWSLAPAWAHWIARDKSGSIYAYQEKPKQLSNGWTPATAKGPFDLIRLAPRCPTDDWQCSLEKRPEDEIDIRNEIDYKAAARAWADGQEVQHRLPHRNHWQDGLPTTAGADTILLSPSTFYRIKPKTRELAGVEFPEPVRQAPAHGTRVFIASILATRINVYYWQGLDCLDHALQKGMVQATREGAEAQRRAMIEAVGGSVDDDV